MKFEVVHQILCVIVMTQYYVGCCISNACCKLLHCWPGQPKSREYCSNIRQFNYSVFVLAFSVIPIKTYLLVGQNYITERNQSHMLKCVQHYYRFSFWLKSTLNTLVISLIKWVKFIITFRENTRFFSG